jgi:hypothetical protein
MHVSPITAPTDTTTTLQDATTSLDAPTPSTPATPPLSDDERTVHRHVVAPREHLWSIARQALAERLGRDPTDAELVPYWRRVCDWNRSTLRSGDVDLVFPGELVEVPWP